MTYPNDYAHCPGAIADERAQLQCRDCHRYRAALACKASQYVVWMSPPIDVSLHGVPCEMRDPVSEEGQRGGSGVSSTPLAPADPAARVSSLSGRGGSALGLRAGGVLL